MITTIFVSTGHIDGVCVQNWTKVGAESTFVLIFDLEWKFVLHLDKFSIVDISVTVGPSSNLSLICDHDNFCAQNWTEIEPNPLERVRFGRLSGANIINVFWGHS